MTGRFGKRVRTFSLIPAVGATILLAACGSGTASAATATRISAAARVLTVIYGAGFPGLATAGAKPARPVSVTITDLVRVRQVAGLIDGLSLAPPGEEWSCPAGNGSSMKLTFRSGVGGRTLATVSYTPTCPPVWVVIAGVGQGRIQSVDLTSKFLRIAGIPAATAS